VQLDTIREIAGLDRADTEAGRRLDGRVDRELSVMDGKHPRALVKSVAAILEDRERRSICRLHFNCEPRPRSFGLCPRQHVVDQ
jgi:hypothetical protein